MYSLVDINKIDNKTLVSIRPQKGVVYKITVLIISILILVAPIGTALVFFVQHIKMNFEALLIIGVNIILLIFVYKHLRATYRKEIIVIENNKLAYSNSFLGLGKWFQTDLNKIKSVRYIGYGQQTKHPLEIKGDVLGFGTQQGEIDYLNQTGTMMLVTEYQVLKFGADVDEEDYLKIKQLLD